MQWIQFIVSATVIILAGVHLTKHADRLSDQMNLGKAWVGLLLLGLITSLPEAITCIVSVKSLNADDLAVGNLLGSNNFNPMLIVVMDIIYRKGSITDTVAPTRSIKVSTIYVVIISLIVIFEILFSGLPHWGPISMGGVAIVWLYFTGMHKIADISSQEHQDDASSRPAENVKGSIAQTWIHVIISAAVVIGAAIVLARSADSLAAQTGLGRTFFGSIFVAIVTSLPEMVVTVSALKMGSIDLAIGNIFGSNLTNLFFIFLCSLVNPEGPILNDVASSHILTAVMSLLLIMISFGGIRSKSKKTIAGLGWDSWLMTAVFILGTAFLYALR